MKKKFTLKQIQELFLEDGCVLLESEYINNSHKMKYICNCGKESSISLSNFKRGSRCYDCKGSKISKSKRLPYDKVKSIFEESGCELLSKDYKNNSQKLEYICCCGKVSTCSLGNFQAGKRCCGYSTYLEKIKKEKTDKKSKKEIKVIDRKRNFTTVWCLNCNFCKINFYSNRSDTRRCKNCKNKSLNYHEPKEDFSRINSDIAYMIGFLFGDGSSDGEHSIRIGLSRKKANYNLLSKFIDLLYTKEDRPEIKEYGELFHIILYNKDMVNNLKKFGIVKNKTYDSSFVFPPGFKKDFIRGYFDADGWIGFSKGKNVKCKKIYTSYSLGLCSYLEENLLKINNEMPIRGKITKKSNQELYELRWYSVESIEKIKDFMYYENCLCLENKKWKLEKVGKIKPKIYCP